MFNESCSHNLDIHCTETSMEIIPQPNQITPVVVIVLFHIAERSLLLYKDTRLHGEKIILYSRPLQNENQVNMLSDIIMAQYKEGR